MFTEGQRVYTKRKVTLTKAEADAFVSDYGSINAAAVAMSPVWGLSIVQATRVLKQGMGSGADRTSTIPQSKISQAQRLITLLEKSGFSVDDVGTIQKIRIGSHRGFIKNASKEIEYTNDLPADSIVFTPSWEEGPQWPVMQPARPVTIKPTVYRRRQRTGKTIVVVPDVQVGFYRSIDNVSQLTPIHDDVAIDVALQIITDIQPDQLVHVGDFLDLPEMSRWLQHEEFWRTTQPAIDEGHAILARFESAAGPRENRTPTQFIEGNHDRRLREYSLKNARASFHLRPAMATPDSWPDLSVPHLLKFDELGIEYCGAYPGSEYWITPSLVVRHNPESKDAYDASVIAGHSHRISRTTYSRRSHIGAKHWTLFEIGCLCRIDNYADKKALMRTSVPSDRGFIRNWTQGLAVVHVDDDGQFSVEQIEIHNGKALYRGRAYASQKRAA